MLLKGSNFSRGVVSFTSLCSRNAHLKSCPFMLQGPTPFLKCKMQCLFYVYLTVFVLSSTFFINILHFYATTGFFSIFFILFFCGTTTTIGGLACCKNENQHKSIKDLSITLQKKDQQNSVFRWPFLYLIKARDSIMVQCVQSLLELSEE